jgi:hypothetical protein
MSDSISGWDRADSRKAVLLAASGKGMAMRRSKRRRRAGSQSCMTAQHCNECVEVCIFVVHEAWFKNMFATEKKKHLQLAF